MFNSPRKLSSLIQKDIEPFWVGSLTLLVLLLGYTLLPFREERLEWALYLLCGTVLPALVVGVHFLPLPLIWSQTLRTLLALVFVVIAAYLAASYIDVYILLFSLVHFALTLTIWKSENQNDNLITKISFYSVLFFVILLSWTIGVRLIVWTPYDTWFLTGTYRFLVFILLLVLVTVSVYFKPSSWSSLQLEIWSVGNIAALLMILWVSFRTAPLINGAANVFHHWGIYVGPVALVREGGWLLWDVPSQYGFLSILLASWLPFESAWQAVYILNASLIFLSASILFFFFRSLNSSFSNLLFSLLIALAAGILLQGPPGRGVYIWPSNGPYRFFWCYVLLVILWWAYRSSPQARRKVLWIGCLAWTLGSLWSFESMFYCTVTWLPAYILLVLQQSWNRDTGRRLWGIIQRSLFWLILPLLMLAGAVAFLQLYYLIWLGHAPDWMAFAEYVLSIQERSLGSVPVPSDGAFWVIMLILCALLTAVVYLLRFYSEVSEVAPVIGAMGAVWSITSYYIGNSRPQRINIIIPFCFIGIALILHIFAQYENKAKWMLLIKTTFVPVLAIVLVVIFADWDVLESNLTETYANVEQVVPVMDDSLRSFLDKAGVNPDDPTVYVGIAAGRQIDLGPARPISNGSEEPHLMVLPRSWLSINPILHVFPLPEKRRKVYMERFAERRQVGGWLIEPKERVIIPTLAEGYFSLAWFYDQLDTLYIPTKMLADDQWRATWYEFRQPNIKSNLIIPIIHTSSTHPELGNSALLFDDVPDPINAWHSQQWPDFPQWIEISFNQPVELEWLGFEAQIGSPDRAPRNVIILGGEDIAQEVAQLTFEYEKNEGWSFRHLSDSKEKFKRYRIVILDNHGQPEYLSIQDMRYYVLVEEGYKGFNIIADRDKFYILDQSLGSINPAALERQTLEEYRTFCIQRGRCGVADSLDEAKQLIEQVHQKTSQVVGEEGSLEK